MRLDLGSAGVNILHIAIELSCDDNLFDLLAKYNGNGDEDEAGEQFTAFIAAGTYRVKRQLHLSVVMLYTDNKNEWRITMRYSTMKGVQQSPEAMRDLGRMDFKLLKAFLDDPALTQIAGVVDCGLQSHTPPPFDSIVELPMLRLTGTDAPFDQISGVRLTKFVPDGADIDYTAVLDLGTDKHLISYIKWSFPSDVGSGIPLLALKRGLELRNKLVKLKPTIQEELANGGTSG